MGFFDSLFDGLADLSRRLPAIEIKAFCISAAVILAVAAVVIGLTFFASRTYKLRRACSKVLAYLARTEVVDDDNVADFTSECFGAKAPNALRESWVSYLGVRFGYPSAVVTDEAVFDKEVKRPDSVRASVFIAVALIVTAIFTFWGLGTMDPTEVGVVVCGGLLVSAIGYLVLWLVARNEYKRARLVFDEMQEELDAKVFLQHERDYATDASPLLNMAAIMEGIVAKNTARPAPEPEQEAEEGEGGVAPAPAGEDEVLDSFPAEGGEEAEGYAKTPLELAAEGDGEAGVVEKTEEVSDEGESSEQEQVGRNTNTVSEEITDEDEENMFGRKKKKLQQAEMVQQGYDDLVVDAEIIADDDGEGADEATLVGAPAGAQPYANGNMARGSKPESLEGLNIASRPVADSSVTVSLEPEVIYVEEDLDEGDDEVKPPRLAKLPHLVDYVLTMKLSFSMKMRVAMLMLQAYTVFKNSPENKAIVVQCLKKVMQALIADRAAAKAAEQKAKAEAEAAADAAEKSAE